MNRRAALAGLAAVVAAPAIGAPFDPWAALQQGGVAILLRHARTEPGVGDPPGFRIGDCSTQRNLSDEGRDQARRIGAAITAREVRIGEVLSSQWCRCLETARLAFPGRTVEPWPALNSFFDDRSAEARRTSEAAARIGSLRVPTNVVFVTHHVNILALTGEAVGSGEAVLVRADGGSARLLGSLSF